MQGWRQCKRRSDGEGVSRRLVRKTKPQVKSGLTRHWKMAKPAKVREDTEVPQRE